MYVQVDKRRLKRVNLLGDTAVFVDNGCYYKGKLTDVSYEGFRVNFPSISSQSIFWPNLSVFFSPTIWRLRKCKIIISTRIVNNDANTLNSSSRTGKNCMVSAYPRWIMKKDTRMDIGFKIPESSVGWQFFVHQHIVGDTAGD